MIGLLLTALALAEPDAPPALTAPPQLVELTEAAYPEEARAAGIEAEVRLAITLDEEGGVVSAEVLVPVGHGFDEAARAAVLASRFSPAMTAEGPTGIVIEFAYAFTIAEPAAANLGGIVRQKGTKTPLAGVEVQVAVGEARHATVTDDDGRWEIAVPAGPAAVRTVFPGHDDATATVEVTDDTLAEVTLWMRSRDYEGTVAMGLYERPTEVVVTRRSVSMEEARAVPGTLGDPIRVIQNLPGAARPPLGSGQLIIRGANPADSRVFIDGVEVPIIYHLGGFRSVVPADMVGSVDYLPGSYPVRYGRGGAGVVDIHTTRDYPEQWALSWRTDLLDTGASMRGRIGDVGVTFGARRSYLDALLPAFTTDDAPSISPSWFDYQLKVEGLSGPGRWSVFVFGLTDELSVVVPEDFDGGEGFSGGLSDAYDSHRIVGRYERELSDTLRFSVQPSAGIDSDDTDLGTEVALSEDNVRLGLRSRLDWTPSERLTVSPGLDWSLTGYDSSTVLPGELPFSTDSSIDEDEGVSEADDGLIFAPDTYIEAQLRPLPDPERLVLQPGLRLVTVGISDAPFQAALDPRLAGRLTLWEGSVLKGGTGLHHQPPQDRVLVLSGEDGLGLERTWSSEVGIEQQLGEGGSIDLTGFYRDTTGRFVINEDRTSEDDPFFLAEGLGRAMGMEVMLRRAPIGPLSGWVSYTLSRSERMDDPDSGEWILFDYDQTHILTATGTWRLPYDLNLSGRYQYVTGNPTTPYEGGVVDLDSGTYTGVLSGAENSDRVAPYSSLDLRVSRLWTFNRWQLDTFVDLLGVVQGENPEGEVWAYDYSTSTEISGLPFVPSVGFQLDTRF